MRLQKNEVTTPRSQGGRISPKPPDSQRRGQSPICSGAVAAQAVVPGFPEGAAGTAPLAWSGPQTCSDVGFVPQEDAAGEGTGLGAVAGALGGPAADQPGETPAECGQPADLEWGKDTGVGGVGESGGRGRGSACRGVCSYNKEQGAGF